MPRAKHLPTEISPNTPLIRQWQLLEWLASTSTGVRVAHAAKAFAEYREATGTLRGCAFQARRPKCTPNGKVAIITNTVNLAKCKLPKEPNLILALSVIWRLPIQGLQLEHQNHRPDKVTTEAGPLHEMREQPDNAADPEQTERRRAELLAAFTAPPKPNGKAKPTKAPA